MFEKVQIEFQEKTYSVKPKKVLELIAGVEEYITLQEILDTSKIKVAKITQAFCFALSFADLDDGSYSSVELHEVHQFIMDDKKNLEYVLNCLSSIIMNIAIPPKDMLEDSQKEVNDDGEKKQEEN